MTLNEDNFLINAKLDLKTLTFEKKRRSAPVNNGYKTLSYKYENFPVLINNFSLAFLESDKEVRRRFLDYFMFYEQTHFRPSRPLLRHQRWRPNIPPNITNPFWRIMFPLRNLAQKMSQKYPQKYFKCIQHMYSIFLTCI